MVELRQRPIVPPAHPNEIEHRRLLAERANASFPKDGSEGMTQPLKLKQVAVADVPTASLWTGSLLYITDEIGGATPAFSDGTNWRRTSDRAIIS